MIHVIEPVESIEPSGLRLFAVVALAMTLVACEKEPEVVYRTVVIEEPAPTAPSQATSSDYDEDSLYEETLAESVEEIEQVDRVIAEPYYDDGPAGVTPTTSVEEMSQAQLDGLVSDALATEEGRQMLAPLFGEEMLEREASRSTSTERAQPTRVVIQVRGQSQNETPVAQTGYYANAGYVGAQGQPLFVDPSGQIVDADGRATSPANVPFDAPINAYEVSPAGFNAPIDNPARTRATPDGSPIISQIPARSSLPSQTPVGATNSGDVGSGNTSNTQSSSPLPSQVPPRSSQPSQIPAGAGNVGRAPAGGPPVSGPGVAGF